MLANHSVNQLLASLFYPEVVKFVIITVNAFI